MFNKIKRLWNYRSSDSFTNYLRSKGIEIGAGCSFRPRSTVIDVTRPSLVTIGRDCYFNENFTLLTHDWVTNVFIHSGKEFLPSSGAVKIGNNVSFGTNVMILKGVTIGDNCFIGANSLVTKDIPSNSIAAGSPCKVLCPLNEYYEKRRVKCVEEALIYAKSIQDRFHRIPTTIDFWEEFPLFVDGDNISDYPELAQVIKAQCGPSYEDYVKYHKAPYKDFDTFLKAAGVK